jgi:hypothetical protein
MRVRKLDSNGDMTFGHGGADYYVNDPVGVAQIVSTRLRLWLGQWFLYRSDGMPWLTKVIGKYTEDTRDAAITNRIFLTPGVLSIATYQSQLNRNTREFDVQAYINTIYGPAQVQTGPF